MRLASQCYERLRHQGARDEGQVMLLGIGVTALVLALVLVVAAATTVYLDLKHLVGTADLAAAAAASQVGQDEYFRSGANPEAPLDDAGVESVVREYLRSAPERGGLVGVEIAQAYTPDGAQAVVGLRGYSRLPFVPWGLLSSEGFELRATASSRVVSR